jgi:hypothetical protein
VLTVGLVAVAGTAAAGCDHVDIYTSAPATQGVITIEEGDVVTI